MPAPYVDACVHLFACIFMCVIHVTFAISVALISTGAAFTKWGCRCFRGERNMEALGSPEIITCSIWQSWDDSVMYIYIYIQQIRVYTYTVGYCSIDVQ